MYNFEHEIGNIRDRYLRHLLGFDLFHDGYIFDTTFLNDGKDVQLVISCERDWAVDHGVERGYTSGHHVPDNQFDDKYRYVITFKDCQYFAREVSCFPIEYLNGRFKDSAKLAKVIQRSEKRKRYYHFRIQTHKGCLDMIFSGFAASKMKGEINLPGRIDRIQPFDVAVQRYKDIDVRRVREIAKTEHDTNRYIALQYLCHVNDPAIIELSISNLQRGDVSFFDAAVAAIYALGQHGGIEALPHLTRLFDREVYPSDLPIARLHVEDAIEKILYRAGNTS
jgi:hypothetical protein